MANIISKIKASNTDHGIRAGYMYYGTTTGTESALAVTIKEDGGNTISIPELVKGMTFALTFHVVPSTSATLSVNGLTGKPIHYDNGLTGKQWVIGETYVFIYNGTAFVAISSYDDYTVTLTGSGNAITSISKSGRSITATKGSTFLTAHPTISKSTDTTSTQSVAHQGSFTVIDSVTRDSNGHVTKVNTKTITLPSDVGETNQNAFSNVVVGSTTIAADSKTDTLTLVAGSNITLTPDATNDKITIAATDTNTHNLSKNIIGAKNATANSSQGNGGVYLTHIENSEVTSSHKITGGGGTTVKCDGSGNITIGSGSINNATVTIKQNNSNKGSFTLNQTTDATINLTDTIFDPSERLRVSGEFLQDQNGDLETFTCDGDVENPYVTFSLTDPSEGEKLIHGRQLQLVGESGVSIRANTEGKIFFNVDGGVGEQGPRGYQGYQGFRGYQGYQGTAGTNGTSAGFGTPTASVDANVGTPSVTVTATGGNTAKVFNFAFKNLKGAPGADGAALTYVNKSDATVCNSSYTWDISSTTRSYTTYNGGGTITITSSSTPRNCNEHYLLIRNCGGGADTGVVTFRTTIGPLIAKSNTINIPVNGYVEVSVVYIPSAGFTGSNKPTLVLTCSEAMTQVI